jgi:hypothetical protein
MQRQQVAAEEMRIRSEIEGEGGLRTVNIALVVLLALMVGFFLAKHKLPDHS